ncbi:toxin-antitoxin system, antitoxin component [Leptospira neocaledonica]|uniref:Toxin-antitoxin system, antitoxin component n=1 Tax=Leptospira neocaledonica TaxID=2023192 RepID=A0A2M9ZZL3_9LEPT|nr:toxin-antitoxin system, antitoxin component [Leptospira neocaledonica]PJZ77502.1 toxin-antitoxin system, antitoxin component [Leptospira neocaledonica]
MRDEYDFSKGKRGTYSRDLKNLHFPIYLDPKLEEYYKKIALKKNEDLSTIINAILKKEMELNDSLI